MSAKFKTTNPAVGEVLEEFPTADDTEAEVELSAKILRYYARQRTAIADR